MARRYAQSPGPLLVWFRRDLRLADHPALHAAVRTGQPLLPVFVLSSAERRAGGASRWWLHGSLASLASALARQGSRLVLRTGDPAQVLPSVARDTGATALYFNRSWQPEERHTELRVTAALEPLIGVHGFPGDCLHEPGSVRSGAGQALRVFTPFWRACLQLGDPPAPRPAPPGLRNWPGPVVGESLADWRLLPRAPDWAGGLRQRWRPGEASAIQSLDDFLDDGLDRYHNHRDRPDLAGTSRLSPHLHFGEIGPRQVWHAVRSRASGQASLAAGADAYLRELGWREFSLHLLHFWPDLPTREFQRRFAGFPWRRDRHALQRWQRGTTGYPLVDAGMRELWSSGWMHNRVRMVAASFLVKHLLLDWRAGEAWFWDTLVDADLANNSASWQWVAGCGAEAAPYFRIFNPTLQGRKFDPDGNYVRQWLPELARIGPRYVHAPWTAPKAELDAAGIRLGKTYPLPIIAHDVARQRALAAYGATGNLTGENDRKNRPLSRRRSSSGPGRTGS